MEQLSTIVTSFENLMIAGGSLFALWGVYNLLEENDQGTSRPRYRMVAGARRRIHCRMRRVPHHLPAF